MSAPLLTLKDIAARLGVPERTLQRLISEGRFPRPRLVAARELWTEFDFECWLHLEPRMQPDAGPPAE